jgi:hypothetical protein
MLFPLGFMIVLSIFAVAYTGETYDSGITEDYSNVTGNIEGDPTYVEIPEAGSYEFDIWTTAGIMLILTGAIAAAIVAGISVLGSGLGGISQSLILNSILFGGLWACLSAVAQEFVFSNDYTSILWTFLSITYIIGVGSHMTGAD